MIENSEDRSLRYNTLACQRLLTTMSMPGCSSSALPPCSAARTSARLYCSYRQLRSPPGWNSSLCGCAAVGLLRKAPAGEALSRAQMRYLRGWELCSCTWHVKTTARFHVETEGMRLHPRSPALGSSGGCSLAAGAAAAGDPP